MAEDDGVRVEIVLRAGFTVWISGVPVALAQPVRVKVHPKNVPIIYGYDKNTGVGVMERIEGEGLDG